MAIFGPADKAVGKSPERERAALSPHGLAFASKRIAVNLSPANIIREAPLFCTYLYDKGIRAYA